MITVQISADSRYPINRKRLKGLVKTVLTRERMTSDLVVSVAVVGDRKMRTLNRQFHHTDATTDVLSFPYLDDQSNSYKGKFVMHEEQGAVLGDIVVSYPEAVRQAQVKGKLVDDEVDFLVEHGLMHLLGNHHE